MDNTTSIYGYNPHYLQSNGAVYQPQMTAGRSSVPSLSHTAATYMANPPVQRRRISPDAILGMEAPTQPRRYITPSATSKKELPAFIGNSLLRRRSPSDDEEDELAEEAPASNATDQEKIEWKRRQNTLAARRSRKRKLQYQGQLEDTVERLTMEKEVWKTRALTLKQLLHSHGIPCPDFKD